MTDTSDPIHRACDFYVSSGERDIVALNAGAGLFVASRAASVREGIAAASDALASGRARGVLGALGLNRVERISDFVRAAGFALAAQLLVLMAASVL